MAYMLVAGLALSAATAALGMRVDHHTQVDHHSGPVAVSYRGDVAISHKQVGTVAPAGKMSSLRCQWAAHMVVARQATAAGGASLSRTMDSAPVLTGSRPGWCSTHQAAITKEVARKTAAMQDHLQQMAQDDHQMLRAELDRLHGAQRAG
ncbi:hypothetical protein [Sphingomonas sp.]|uniref:hypothetical protein n=1 Tax=Sphingomonas sp. TaxID=28214 RepID=UPI003B3BDCFD